ncbi:MAG: FAD-binding protein [Adlercreutzia equolifaciens]
MKKADTLEELADMLGFAGEAKQNFLAQVDRYNELFDAQADEDFGKEAYRLSAIRQAPFYGCWYGGSLLTTIDGLTINEEMQVLNTEGVVIEGLYAAGDCSGSLFAGTYPEYVVPFAAAPPPKVATSLVAWPATCRSPHFTSQRNGSLGSRFVHAAPIPSCYP